MDPLAYAEYLEHLVVALASDERVLGLIGTGASAGGEVGPWSDHEVWVVAGPDGEESLRADPSWLPRHGRLVLWMRESRRRMCGVYDDGSMVSAGVSDLDGVAALDDPGGRVLLDKGGVADRLREVRRREPAAEPGPGHLAAGFVSALLRGLRRHAAGQLLEGRRLVCHEAAERLLALAGRLDGADGEQRWRRAERDLPELAGRIGEALEAPTPRAALGLLAVAETSVKPRVGEWPDGAAAVVRRTASALLSR